MSRSSPVPRLLTPLARLRNVWLVMGAALLGLLVPAGRVLAPLVTPLVVVLVSGSLRGLRPADLDRSDGVFLLVALLVAHLGVPLAAAAVGSRLLAGAPLLGVLVIAAAPTTAGSAIIWSRLGGGDAALTTVVALFTILLSPIVLPATLSLILTRSAPLSPVPVVRELTVIVAGGLALAWLVPDDRVDASALRIVSRVAIALLVYISVASSDPTGTSTATLGTVVAVALAVTGTGLALASIAGHVLDFDRERIRSLFFATSLKNLGIALLVAASLGVPEAVAAITVYYVSQQIISALLVEIRN